MTTTAHEIATWLGSLPHTLTVAPLSVTIQGVTYPAASYVAQFDTPAGYAPTSKRAYRSGERKYLRNFIYCVGILPYRGSVAFTIENDPTEWYVAFYAGQIKQRKQNIRLPHKGAPFGDSFGLAAWDLPDAIDKGVRVPYRRVPLTIGAPT